MTGDGVPNGRGSSEQGRRPARVLYYYSHHHVDTGSPRALLSMIELLDRSRFEPLFLATGSGPLVAELRNREVGIVEGTAAPVGYRAPWDAVRRTRRQARRLAALGVDILHCNEFGWNLDLVLGAWLARIPVVLHLHNPPAIHRRNLHNYAASRVLCVSASHAELLGASRTLRRKCRVLYNSVDVDRFARARPMRERLGLGPSDRVVGCVAQISRAKGTDVLVEAARRVVSRDPRVVFLVVGPAARGEERLAEELERRAAEPEFDGRLRFLGSRDDVPELLASMDLFVLPTRAETFGIVLIEAMAAGLPVLTTPVGGVPEIVNDPGLGVLLPDPDPDGLAGAIERLLADPERAREMGRRGRESVRGRFDRASIGIRLNRLYEELLAG